MAYILSLVAMVAIYSILTLSTNFMLGYCGIVTLAQAAVFGVAAYTVAILTSMGWGFWLALIPAVLFAALCNIIMTLPSMRVGGIYFMVVSFGFSTVMSACFKNLEVTGGSYGISGIPKAHIFGISLSSMGAQAILMVVILIIGIYIAYRIFRSPFGALVEACRQESSAVEAVGKSVIQMKISLAILGGIYAGVAGGLYAQYMSYIDPVSFTLTKGFDLSVYVMLGGAATLLGSVAGPLFLLLVPQLITFLPISSTAAGPLQNLIYGAVLIIFMILKPGGIIEKIPGDRSGMGIVGVWIRKILRKEAAAK